MTGSGKTAALPGPKSKSFRSSPVREDCPGLRNLRCRTGEVEFQFSAMACDLNFDRIEAVVFDSEAELFVGFSGSVFLEAVGHARASAHGRAIATAIGRLSRRPRHGSIGNAPASFLRLIRNLRLDEFCRPNQRFHRTCPY